MDLYPLDSNITDFRLSVGSCAAYLLQYLYTAIMTHQYIWERKECLL